MAFNEMNVAPQTAWVKVIGWKMGLISFTLLVFFVIWESPLPSFLDYSQLSASQIQSIFGRNDITESAPANTPSDSTPGNVPTIHTDSPGADSPEEQTKKRPVETIKPDPNIEFPDNTTTVSVSTPTPIKAISNAFGEDDTQLVPGNTTEVSESPTNATSDVFAKDDTQRVDLSTIKDDPRQSAAEAKKYIVPLLTKQLGTGNQLMEYKSAAVIARTLNRTLCLMPFFGGPTKHFGYLGDRNSGLVMEDRYDIDVLSKFVKVADMDECMQQCRRTIDAHWQLSPRVQYSKAPNWDQWFNVTPTWSLKFVRKYEKWRSTAEVEKAMGPGNDAHCVSLGGLFPGLQWSGVVIAASAYMQHSAKVKKAADLLQARALPGSNENNFIAVHWRFEESKCRGYPLGLCFTRRPNGALIANGRRSDTWENMTHEDLRGRFKAGQYRGVALTKEDISCAIHDRAVQWGAKTVYLATDGWLRGQESAGIVKWVVNDIRSKGINVVGLWKLFGLPNFADGYYVSADNMAELFGLNPKQKVSNYIIALVEQELCLRAAVFVGSSQSTWSLAVADTRRGRRCKQELTEVMTGLNVGTVSPEVMERAIIDKILTIQYVAGPTCSGGRFNSTMQKYEDEIPDGWLDYDSCEVRLLHGVGSCKRISA